MLSPQGGKAGPTEQPLMDGQGEDGELEDGEEVRRVQCVLGEPEGGSTPLTLECCDCPPSLPPPQDLLNFEDIGDDVGCGHIH